MPIVLRQDGGPVEPKGHQHVFGTEHFINRPEIEFKKCGICGWKVYPEGMVQVFGGSHTEILWPS